MDADWKTIEHHNYTVALDKAFQTATAAEPGHCILITGPTGVGKSTVLASVLDMLVGPPHTWPEGHLHYISIECDCEAPASITRSIAVDLNRALDNPFVALQLPTRDGNHPFFPVRAMLNEHDLRDSFRVQGALRGTRYVGVDAVENIAPRREISAETRFNSIKSLVRPHTRHVRAHKMTLILAGHYSPLMYWRVNAQLARRVTEIPVLPYRRTAQDIDHFEELLHFTSQHFPLKHGRSLRDWNDVLFDLSGGCIGLLRKLLHDAVIQMSCRKGTSLDLDDIIAAAPPKLKLENMKRDLDGFWSYIETSATDEVIANAKARECSKNHETSTINRQRKIRRIGRKAAPRDPVGGLP